MTIAFDQIPIALLLPGTFMEFDASRAGLATGIQPYRALVLGQKTAGGSAPANVPVPISDPGEVESLFGDGSMAARLARAFRGVNRFNDMDVLPLDDDGGAIAATGTITFGGTNSDGTLVLYIAGERLTVLVSSGDTPADIATDVVAAITGEPTLPVTAVVNGGVPEQVDLTAKNAGEIGNTIDVRVNHLPGEKLPDGVTVAIVALSGGTTNPSLATAIANIAGTQYNVIVFPYTDAASLTAIEAELLTRWGPLVAKEGVAIAGEVDTVGNLQTLGDSRNSQFLAIVGLEPFPGVPAERAAAVAAHVTFEGQQDPARPLQTLRIPGYAPSDVDRFSDEERDMLLQDGVSTLRTAPGSVVQIERLVTTRTLNDFASPDTAFQDVNDVLALSFIRFDFVRRFTTAFPRHKLADAIGPVDQGQNVLTPGGAKAEAAAWYDGLVARAIVQDTKLFLEESLFEVSGTNPNRLDVLLAVRLVGQARTIATRTQFRQ